MSHRIFSAAVPVRGAKPWHEFKFDSWFQNCVKNICCFGFNCRHQDLRNQQTAERLGIEEAHVKEISEFQTQWDKQMADFEEHAMKLTAELAGILDLQSVPPQHFHF